MDSQTAAYEVLRDAILAFVASHRAPEMAGFKAAMAAWGDAYRPVDAEVLPASGFIAPVLDTATGETRPLAQLFDTHKAVLKWEQSYRKTDGLVGDDMLSGYGFAEVIGQRGPFVSENVRAGVGVWGAGIDYPSHHHAAEEIYVPLAGYADFAFDDGPADARRGAGDVVHMRSMRRHGFRTTDSPFVVFYIWQAGDLRETSTFGGGGS